MPESGRERLRSDFGDAIRIDNEEIKLQRETSPETDEQRKQDITQSLRERAREIAERGRTAFEESARSENRAVAIPPGLRSPEGIREILASTSAVSAGRKLLYHEKWTGFAESIGIIQRSFRISGGFHGWWVGFWEDGVSLTYPMSVFFGLDWVSLTYPMSVFLGG